MAGVILFINKKKRDTHEFVFKIKRLRTFIERNYKPFFKDIGYEKVDSNTFIVLFKKDHSAKFIQDSFGWMAYEGSVFLLSQSKMLSVSEIWQLYKEKGENITDDLDGHFVIKLYDKKQNKYLVINDFINSRTNFFAEDNNYLLFTPFALAAGLIVKPQPDWYAINEYLWRYYILSERSLLRNIKRLAPASVYEIREGILKRSTYWTFPQSIYRGKFDVAVEKITTSLMETARLLSGSFGTVSSDLTQGQDSRLLVASFTKQDLAVTTTIFGKSDFSEVKNVKKIAAKHTIPHHNIQLTNEFETNFWNYFQKALLLSSGDEPGYLLGRILFMREEQSKFGNALLNGAGGPFYKDCFWEEVYSLNFYREPHNISMKKFLKLRSMNKNYQDSIFNEAYLKVKANSSQYFINMLQDSIAGYSHLPVSMQIDKFSLTKWQNYAIAANSVSNSVFNSFAPLLLRRNLELSLNLPAKWRWNKSRLQRAVMYKIDPELAKERTDFGGISMSPINAITALPFYSRYFYFQSARFRNKILNNLGFNVKTHLQEAWNYLPLYKKLFQNRNIQDHLQIENMHLAEILEGKKWQRFLNNYKKPDEPRLNDFEFVFKLAGIEYLLKKAKEI